MKRCAKIWLLFSVVFFTLVVAGRVQAQNFTVLHSFAGPLGGNVGTDGTYPLAGLALSGNTLYGTTSQGGTGAVGTIFSVNTDGSGFTNFYHFAGGVEGGNSWASVIVSGNTLYGTTFGGVEAGIVFKVNTDGSGFTNLHNFTATDNVYPGRNQDGAGPQAALTLSEGILYGTTTFGGIFGGGTVFKISTNGTAHTVLHNFSSYSDLVFPNTSYDGSKPQGGALLLNGNTLYGTAEIGGQFGGGTVFAIKTDGTGFSVLHHFAISDGDGPFGGVILSGNSLYGVTLQGGGNNINGTLFKLNTDGTGFTNLHYFTDNSPWRGLVLLGNTLYGASEEIFSINTDGSEYTAVYNAGSGFPLVTSGVALYGATFIGGSLQRGSVFKLSFPPQLDIRQLRENSILAWPTNYAGFDYSRYILQSTTNLSSSAWTTNLPAPVMVNGVNTVINPISGARQFFRLAQ